jgi:hypothetical protein
MALSADSIAEAIAGLDVDGVTIRDLDALPQAINPTDCPMAYPAPEKFLVLEDAVQLTFGPNALWQYTYLVTYRFVQGPAGKERKIAKTALGRVVNYTAFVHAITANAQLIGAAHVKPASTPEWGLLGDPSGQQFDAADLALRVVEYSET